MTSEPIEPVPTDTLTPLLAVIDANIFARADWYNPIIEAIQAGTLLAW